MVFRRINIRPSELCLDHTLPTGQTFRWRKLSSNGYVGVLGYRVIELRQIGDEIEYFVHSSGTKTIEDHDESALKEYFSLGHPPLAHMQTRWLEDPTFKKLVPSIPGARVLRQDPTECLFAFLCSQNNHIRRIWGLVEKLCSTYGSPLRTQPPSQASLAAGAADLRAIADLSFHAFPTVQQLRRATEEDLRAAGFGYRAKYIVGTVQALLAKAPDPAAWLAGLRQATYQEAVEQLMELPGVGRKVAACVCLFALDKPQAVPIDVHMWRVVQQHYDPSLKGKSLTDKIALRAEASVQEAFGEYAGWAHNVLFIA